MKPNSASRPARASSTGVPARVHLVHAHPEPESFVASMYHVAHDHFVAQGCEVTSSDLYAMKFNPVASADDFLARSREDYLVYSLEQRHCVAHDALAPDIAREVACLLAADTVVFTFPVFWFGLPAILKGWVDRVFVSGALYGGRRLYGRGGLVGKRAFVATSLGGREHMFGPEAVHGELVDGMLRHFFQGTLGYVGFDVLEPFVAYHVPYIDADARRCLLDELGSLLGALDERACLPMPDLSRFDDTLTPIRSSCPVGNEAPS